MGQPFCETGAAAAPDLEAQHIGSGSTDAGDQTVLVERTGAVRTDDGRRSPGIATLLVGGRVTESVALATAALLMVALVAGFVVVALTSLLLEPGRCLWLRAGHDDRAARRASEPPPVAAGTEPIERKAEQLTPAASTTPSEPTLPALPRRELKAAEPPRVAAIQPQSSEVEQAVARMSKARRAAERASANHYARDLFVSAQAKEREATAGLGKSEKSSALQMFTEAESAYVAAAEVARREAETERQLAPVKAALDDAQAKASTSRKQALTTEADTVVKDPSMRRSKSTWRPTTWSHARTWRQRPRPT